MMLQDSITIAQNNIGKLIAALGSYGSLAGLYYIFRAPGAPITFWEIVLILTAMIFLVLHLMLGISTAKKNIPKILRTDKNIEDYMRTWTRMDGKIAILSRDMSWVEAEMENILTALAARSNLTVFMEKSNPLSARLQEKGADIIFYGDQKFAPATRFALTNEKRSDARVALGFKDADGFLRVEEYTHGDPAFYLCTDLIALLRVLE